MCSLPHFTAAPAHPASNSLPVCTVERCADAGLAPATIGRRAALSRNRESGNRSSSTALSAAHLFRPLPPASRGVRRLARAVPRNSGRGKRLLAFGGMEKLRALDEQLACSELQPSDQAAVAAHLQRMQQLRLEWQPNLRPRPNDPAGAMEWDHQVEMSLATAAANDRQQQPGLQAAWQAWQHREDLKAKRNALLHEVDAGDEELDMLGGRGTQYPAGHQQQLQRLQQTQQQALQQQQSVLPLQTQQQQNPQDLERKQQGAQWQGPNEMGWAHSAAIAATAEAAANGGGGGGGGTDAPIAANGQATELYGDGNSAAPDTSPTAPRPKIGKRQRVEHLPPQPAPGEPVPAGHKQCRKCHLVKTFEDFYRSKANTDGYDGRCKACDALQCVERRRKKQRIETPTVTEKACHKCHEVKPSGEFYRNRTNRDGLYNNCKACFTANSVRRQQNLPPIDARMAETKTCRRCEQEKPATDFYKNRLMLDGLYSHCKACYQASAAQRATHRAPVDNKACRRCNVSKPGSDFYKSKMTADGLQSYCKHCYKITAAQTRVKKLQDEQDALDGPPAPGAAPDDDVDVEVIGGDDVPPPQQAGGLQSPRQASGGGPLAGEGGGPAPGGRLAELLDVSLGQHMVPEATAAQQAFHLLLRGTELPLHHQQVSAPPAAGQPNGSGGGGGLPDLSDPGSVLAQLAQLRNATANVQAVQMQASRSQAQEHQLQLQAYLSAQQQQQHVPSSSLPQQRSYDSLRLQAAQAATQQYQQQTHQHLQQQQQPGSSPRYQQQHQHPSNSPRFEQQQGQGQGQPLGSPHFPQGGGAPPQQHGISQQQHQQQTYLQQQLQQQMQQQQPSSPLHAQQQPPPQHLHLQPPPPPLQ